MFFEATYLPSNRKNLKPDAEKFIGKKILVQSGSIADVGEFKGRYCYISGFDLTFIPDCDLKDIEPSSLERWKQFRDQLT